MRTSSLLALGALLVGGGMAADRLLLAPPGGGGGAAADAPARPAAQAAPAMAGTEADPDQSAMAAVRARLAAAGLPAEGLGLETHRFGPEDELAVCGRLPVVRGDGGGGSSSGAAGDDIVARVLLPGPAPRGSATAAVGGGAPAPTTVWQHSRSLLVVFEDRPGLARGGSAGEAWRRYCRDAPITAVAATAGAAGTEAVTPAPASPAAAMPPAAAAAAAVAMPNPAAPGPAVPAALAAASTAAPAILGGGIAGTSTPFGPAAVPSPAGSVPSWHRERVVVRSPANVRAGPGGWAEVIGSAQRGTDLVVLGRAPGGWVQVETAAGAEGWIHSSLLDATPGDSADAGSR